MKCLRQSGHKVGLLSIERSGKHLASGSQSDIRLWKTSKSSGVRTKFIRKRPKLGIALTLGSSKEHLTSDAGSAPPKSSPQVQVDEDELDALILKNQRGQRTNLKGDAVEQTRGANRDQQVELGIDQGESLGVKWQSSFSQNSSSKSKKVK